MSGARAESLAMAQAYANNAGALIVPLTVAELGAVARCVASVTDELSTVDHLDPSEDAGAELALLATAAQVMGTTLQAAQAGAVGDPPARAAAPTDAELRRALAATWAGRRQAQGWKPGTATHAKHALEFLLGARRACELAGCADAVPELLLVMVSVGRDPVELLGGGS